MGTPQNHLPQPYTNTTITALLTTLSLPAPSSITPLQVTAAFHAIYQLTYSPSTSSPPSLPNLFRNPDGSLSLILRISGTHIPHIKTANEVAVLQWLRRNTRIPVPAVVRFDTSEANPLGREFTLLERIPGRSVDAMYDDDGLSDAAKRRLVEQLTDVLVELNAHEWTHVGGLQLAADGQDTLLPGPVLEDTFWLVPDIEQFWGPGECITTLNPSGPYASHQELVRGYLSVFVHAINTHDSLAWLRSSLNPQLKKLKATDVPQLADTRLILAHKDLHFANVMATEDGTLTGILDWEFAGVVPALRWDPVRAFLWNGKHDEGAGAEKERMRALFEAVLEERGVRPWWTGVPREAELVWDVVRFTRALVEVCPRGQKGDAVGGWRDAALRALKELGIE